MCQHLKTGVGMQKGIISLLTGIIYWCLKKPLRVMWQPISKNSQLLLGFLQRTIYVWCILKKNQKDTKRIYCVPLRDLTSKTFFLLILFTNYLIFIYTLISLCGTICDPYIHVLNVYYYLCLYMPVLYIKCFPA